MRGDFLPINSRFQSLAESRTKAKIVFFPFSGRICAEGLLTFGLGGLAIVYLLAPALDNLLSRIDTRKLTVVAVVLLAFYCVDQAYSAQHPNIGAGITDYKGSATSQVS